MNANEIINDQMTLEEKLAAIDAAMANAVAVKKASNPDAFIDPADLTICFGCQ
jgi:hypothetical protein